MGKHFQNRNSVLRLKYLPAPRAIGDLVLQSRPVALVNMPVGFM